MFGLRRADTSSVSENFCVNKSKLSVKSEKVEETKKRPKTPNKENVLQMVGFFVKNKISSNRILHYAALNAAGGGK